MKASMGLASGSSRAIGVAKRVMLAVSRALSAFCRAASVAPPCRRQTSSPVMAHFPQGSPVSLLWALHFSFRGTGGSVAVMAVSESAFSRIWGLGVSLHARPPWFSALHDRGVPRCSWWCSQSRNALTCNVLGVPTVPSPCAISYIRDRCHHRHPIVDSQPCPILYTRRHDIY